MDELLKDWRDVLTELGFESGTDGWDAACVLVAPIYAASMDPERIAAYTGFPLSFVAACSERLSLSGCWDEAEGTFGAEWDHPEHGGMAFILDAGVSEGIYERVAEGYRFLPPTQRHGAFNRYQSLGCRCSLCRQANTERHRAQRYARATREPPPGSHGKKNTYSNWMCRCDECKAAWVVEMQRQKKARAERAGKSPPTPRRATLTSFFEQLMSGRTEATFSFDDRGSRDGSIRNAIRSVGDKLGRDFATETIALQDGKRTLRIRDRQIA